MIELDQAREDLRKTRFRGIVYLLGGTGLAVVAVILVVMYVGKHEIPSLLLGIAGFFWAGMLFYQTAKTRELERALRAKVDDAEKALEAERLEPESAPPPWSGGGEEDDSAPGGDPGEP